MNIRPAQHAASRISVRAFLASLLVAACMLAAASAASAAPTVTIGGVPPLNQTSGTFSFSADGPAQKLQCSLDGSAFSDCSSPVPVSGLSVASHTFSVRAIGLDASIGTATVYPWTIDITKPPVPLVTGPPDGTVTSDATPTFSGSAEPGARVPVFDGADQIGDPLTDMAGHWTFTPDAPLADGTHLWRVRAVDAAGNRSDYTALRTLKIDTQVPDVPTIDTPASAAKVNSHNPVIAGTAEPQATVAVSEGAVRLCTTSADPNGSWSCMSTFLPDGHHAISAFARDAAGNESGATDREFDLDATPPDAPSITTPLDGLATTATSVTIFGSAVDFLVPVKILINGVEVADETAGGDGGWSHTFSNLAEGDYAFTAKEVDDFGNRSAPSNVVNVRIDRTPPKVTISGHPPLRINETDADFTLTADEPNVTFDCALDGSGWQPCSADPSFSGLTEATHNFKARATDRTGNIGDDSDVFTWTIDLSPPDPATLEAPDEGVTVKTKRPTFSGHAETGADVEVFDGETSLGTAPADELTGAWALTPGSDLAQGPHSVTAVTIDRAGNAAPPSNLRHLTVDTVAPVTTLTGVPAGPTNADSISISFTADDPQASFACSLDNGAFGACASPVSTGYAAEGTHTLRVRARDVAGNVETPGTAQTATIVFDRTAPTGATHVIAGSAGADGIPAFAIESDDPTATSRCKLDNGTFATCIGSYRPTGATSGLHALTVRYGDAAGNQSDQVLAFSVVPTTSTPTGTTTTPPAGQQPTPPQSVCTVLGLAGTKASGLNIASVSGSSRALTVKLRTRAAGLARIDLTAAGSSLASVPLAVKRGNNTLPLTLKRTPAAGAQLSLAIRFYSVKREYATARLALAASAGGVAPASGAVSELDTGCPAVSGSSAGARLSVTSASPGARSFVLDSKGRRPALIALKAYRSGSSAPVADLVLVTRGGRQRIAVRLNGSQRIARGSYRFTYDSFSAGGVAGSGRGAFLAR